MVKKRSNRGRGSGNGANVHCDNCGALVPRDKVKRRSVAAGGIEPALAKELRVAGAIIPRNTDIKNYCISCAVHFGIVSPRAVAARFS